MKLSKRLNRIYQMIDENEIVADIGCDHGQLACALAQDKVKLVYACDLNELPLEKAKELIKYYKLEDRVIPLLSDGLDQVPNDTTTVVIAGMGFDTIRTILDRGKARLNSLNKIIVQANKDLDKIRKYLSNQNYQILEEAVVEEDHFYQIIAFNTLNDQPLNDEELLFGRKMIKDDAYNNMWKYYLNNYQKIIKTITPSNKRYHELQELINKIKIEIEGK